MAAKSIIVGLKIACCGAIMTLLNSTRFDYNEQSIAGMFQPDPITPYDYLRTARRTVHLEPEKHLMHAILEEAIKTFRLHVSTQSARERRLFLDAQLWIMARNDDWLFSFENICEVLGLDPDFVRSGLARWKEQHFDTALVRKTARRQRAVVRPASP
ncbi:MAG: hypothetical protein ACXWZE_12995 [Candidatus Binatia bacterium]